MTLVATVLVAEARGGDAATPSRHGPRATPRWVERLEATLRRSVVATVMLIAPSLRQLRVEPVVVPFPEFRTASRRVLLSPDQFPLPPPAC